MVKIILLFSILVPLSAASCDYYRIMSLTDKAYQEMGGEWYIKYGPTFAQGAFRAVLVVNDKWRDKEKHKDEFPEGSQVNKNHLYIEAWELYSHLPESDYNFAGCYEVKEDVIADAHGITGLNFSTVNGTSYLYMTIWKPDLKNSEFKIEIPIDFVEPKF